MNGIIEAKLLDPYKNQPIALKVVSAGDLEITPHARKPSDFHIKRLIHSIEKLGFLVPLIVVEDPQKAGKYQIIDGQHRFIAATMMQINKLPVIVVPSYLAESLMNFNTEKEMNIRERSAIALSIYRHYLSTKPGMLEAAAEIINALEHAYLVTLGLGYERTEDLSGSAFESVLSKCDFFLSTPLKIAHKIREDRAQSVLTANTLIKNISERLRELGQWHPYVYQQIVTWANPFKRKRMTVEFDELFPPLLENLEKLSKDPKPFIEEVLKEEEEG